MPEEKKKKQNEEPLEEDTPGTEEAAGEAVPEESPAEEPQDGELKAAREEAAALKDRLLRMAAEYDNYKKRTAREKEEIYGNAMESIVKSLLPVLDALDAAHLPEDEAEANGLVQMKKLLVSQLEKLGVTEIDALGKPFDPAVHNAVMHVEDASLGENTVADVFQKGYCYHTKVLRASMVKVAN